jgi:hypothetical protein
VTHKSLTFEGGFVNAGRHGDVVQVDERVVTSDVRAISTEGIRRGLL